MIKKFVCLISLLVISSINYAQVIHSERSLYRNVIVEDNGDIRCLKFSLKRKTSSQSCFNKKQPKALVFNYTKLLFASFLMLDEPKNVLVIGLGGGTMSNSIHQLFPNAKVTNVEIDPAVVKVAREYFDLIENEKIKTEIKDGRIFIKRAQIKKQQFDWVILDAFNGDYIPEHLITQEFLQEVHSILAPNGVLSANTFSSSELYQYESATYQSVFGDFYNVRFNSLGNRVILTTKSGLVAPEIIEQRAEKLAGKMREYNVDIHKLSTLLDAKQDWPANTRLLTDQYSPANLLK
ncbi:MAG: spermidine synthase [Thalassotalea sp.]